MRFSFLALLLIPRGPVLPITYYLVNITIFTNDYKLQRGRDSLISIATGYGLDGPGIEPRWGRDFPHLSRLALEPTQPHVQWVPGLSQG